MTDQQEWLDKTKFWRILSPCFLEVYRRKINIAKKSKDGSVFDTGNWNEYDKRINKLYNRLIALVDHLNDINLTARYLNLNNLDEFLQQNEIEKSEYLRFIYESHQIRLVSTLDICAKLGNEVYQINIKPKYCNWYKFANHKRINELPCSQILSDFSTVLWGDRIERNEIVHSGGYKYALIESIENTEIDDTYLNGDEILLDYFNKIRVQGINKLADQMKTNYNTCLNYSIKFTESMAEELIISLKQNDPQQHL